MKIFFVDDDLFCLNFYQHQVRKLGYEDVWIYKSATDLLNNLPENPDVVFLDGNISDMDGLEVLKKVKEYNPHIYIVTVSCGDKEQPITEFIKNGAFQHIQKGNKDAHRMKSVLEQIKEIKNIIQK